MDQALWLKNEGFLMAKNWLIPLVRSIEDSRHWNRTVEQDMTDMTLVVVVVVVLLVLVLVLVVDIPAVLRSQMSPADATEAGGEQQSVHLTT